MASGIGELAKIFRFLLTVFFNPFSLLLMAFLVAVHQYLYWGKWFEFTDLHHETFIVALVFGAIAVVVWKGFKRWV